MKLKELIAIVDEVYPDGLVWLYYKSPRRNHGDTLAKFIVSELKETYDAKATDAEQLDTANRSIGAAVNQLRDVHRSLGVAWQTHLLKKGGGLTNAKETDNRSEPLR